MTIKECAKLFITLLGDEPPCDFSGIEENTDCEWCWKYCGKVPFSECWEHAIVNGWIK